MNGTKELSTWTGSPISRLRGGRASGHMPGRRKGAEMIQPNHIDMTQQRTQTTNPPTVANLTKSIPVVNGIAPELSGRAEVVRGHARDEARTASFVEEKQLRVGPHIA